MERHERDLNRQAIDGLTYLFKNGISLRPNSPRDIIISRRAIKIAVQTLKEVSPAAYDELCRMHVEDEIAEW
jgi:hypothetical protein